MITKVVNVNLHQPIYERLTAKQGDIASRYLLFHLLDGDKPFDLTGKSVRVYARKPDKTEIFNDLIINDGTKGYCTLELTSQCLASAGVVKMELYISESGKVLTSIPFELEVIPCINTANSVTSTNEFSALEVALSSLQDYDNLRSEIVQARKGHETVGKRMDDMTKQPTVYAQSSRPPKQGVLNCTNKIVYKVNENEYRVIQKTNKQYLLYVLKSGSGGSSTSDTGGNWDLLRVQQVTKVSDVFVYWWDAPINGTVNEYVSAVTGIGEYDKKFVYLDSEVDNDKTFGNNVGLSLWDIPDGEYGEWSINGRLGKKITIHLMVDPYATDDLEISINGVVRKKLNLKTDFGDLGEGRSVTIELENPLRSIHEFSHKIKLYNKGSGKLRLVGFNINRLKDYDENEMVVNNFKCFPTNQDFINGPGANDYAFRDLDNNKWIGSYHGGERLVYGTCTWNDLGTGLSETTETGRKQLSSINSGTWWLLKNFEICQKTNLDNRATMISFFNFDIDGTIEMKFNLVDNTIRMSTLYTCLTCTRPSFDYLIYPSYKPVADNVDDEGYMGVEGVVDGQISQYDSTNKIELTSRFTQFDSGYMIIGNRIWSTANYNKHYYAVVNNYNGGVIIPNLTWSKGLDFYVR